MEKLLFTSPVYILNQIDFLSLEIIIITLLILALASVLLFMKSKLDALNKTIRENEENQKSKTKEIAELKKKYKAVKGLEGQLKIAKEQRDSLAQRNAEMEKEYNALKHDYENMEREDSGENNKEDEAENHKNEILKKISHDIRTPLNALIGFAGLLNEQEISPEQQQEFINHINLNAVNMAHMIEDIMIMSKIESKSIEITPALTSVNIFLADIYSYFLNYKSEIGKDNIEFRLHNPMEKEKITFKTDTYRLKQIISNILQNAFKYTDEGHIELRVNKKDEWLEFYIEDTGMGIPEDQKDIVFNRSNNHTTSVDSVQGYTESGLKLSRDLTTLLDGKLWVETNKHDGSTFYLSVPSMDLDNQITDYNWAGKNIIFAEDESQSFFIINRIISKTKANVLKANNGKEVIDHMKTGKNIDLVLLDIEMPVLDGFETLIELKNEYPDIPVMACTAYGDKQKSVIKAGFDDFIIKPVEKAILLKKISKLLV